MGELDALVQRILKLYENAETDEDDAGQARNMSKDGAVTDAVTLECARRPGPGRPQKTVKTPKLTSKRGF